MERHSMTIEEMAVAAAGDLVRARAVTLQYSPVSVSDAAAVVADWIREAPRHGHVMVARYMTALRPVELDDANDPTGALRDLVGLLEHFAVRKVGEPRPSPPQSGLFKVKGALWCPGCGVRIWRLDRRGYERGRYVDDHNDDHPWPCAGPQH